MVPSFTKHTLHKSFIIIGILSALAALAIPVWKKTEIPLGTSNSMTLEKEASVFLFSPSVTDTIYVDSSATGANNGTSWSDAFTTLQPALAASKFCDTILVAKGTYYPDTIGGVVFNKDLSFNIRDSIVLLGGFPTGGGALDQRDWLCNKTILSGDIDQNGDTVNNSYHVVFTTGSDSSLLVDGFCITGGNAIQANAFPTFSGGGGGWYNDGSSGRPSYPTIRNSIFSNNYAVLGGAMFNNGFSGVSSPRLINCIFRGNSVRETGGAMTNLGLLGSSSPRLINCIFSGNDADLQGGAIANSGIFGGSSLPIYINCVFSGNQASNFGGVMFNQGVLPPGNNGSRGICAPVLRNCIVWNNDALVTGDVFYNDSATPVISYNIFQTNYVGVNSPNCVNCVIDQGNNKYSTDPLFIFAPPAGLSTAGNFHVIAGSPAIDMGFNAFNNYPTDLDAKPRIFNGTIDIGVYEFGELISCTVYSGLTKIYVDSSATSGNNGLTWDNAFTDLQDALAVARFCGVDTILVAQGTYYPSDTTYFLDTCTGDTINTLLPNRFISFNIPESVVLLGGFPTGGDIIGDPYDTRDWNCNKTILCGEIQQDGDNTNNSYHVVYTRNVGTAVFVDGFFISEGYASGLIGDNALGGGWYNIANGNDTSSPVIVNSTLENNYAIVGGGMATFADTGVASIFISHTQFRGNTGDNEAGGLNAEIRQGRADIYITNSIFSGNFSGLDADASAIYLFPGFGLDTMDLNMINSVVSGNASNPAIGHNNERAGSLIINSIFWNNTGDFSFGISPSEFSLRNTMHDGAAAYTDLGGNKIDQDPKFLSSPLSGDAPTIEGDFHVKFTSPAINMGDNSANTELTDFEGNARIQNNIIDIGAYEYGAPDCGLYAGILYVDSTATGANNGSNWDSAFVDLQTALQIAFFCDIDTIFVAQGTYYPDVADTVYACDGSIDTIYSLDRTVSFLIPDSTVVMGGYPSGGIGNRDWRCNKTILCGEIQQDGDSSNNSYHVVTTVGVSAAAVVDGFVIRDGYADGNNMAFFNDLVFGGGWYNDGTSDTSNPTIIHCIITHNFAFNGGGGMFNNGHFGGTASPTLISCILSDNRTSGSGNGGGALYNYSESPNSVSSPVLINCILSGNFSGADGGAIYNNSETSGAHSEPELINCVVSGNFASNDGGAMYSFSQFMDEDTVIITNSIFWNNQATNGMVFSNNSCYQLITNSLFQGTDFPSITSGNLPIDNGGNKFVNPQFIFAPVATDAPTPSGNFHVFNYSPAIDMGNNAAIIAALAGYAFVDLDDSARIVNTVDMGAYELQGPDCLDYTGLTKIYVDITATGANDGTSWSDAFTDLQDALLVIQLCPQDTILVAEGTYYPSDTVFIYDPCSTGIPIDTIFPDRNISFNIPDSAVLLGGFPTGGGTIGDPFDSRDWACNKTILCGDIDLNGDTLNNSFHVVYTRNVDSVTLVDGFFIQGGNANVVSMADPLASAGGGWINDGS
ncbi:MAG: choice-of-anchor Q domain-containing protein, partial [Saprospiraceae bacterium]|nr:choice-of-anchor Q domain-containing protein [Saprospiraceae bacterium]